MCISCSFNHSFPCNAAVCCAERGLKAHLLLRGEEPETLTGYNLVSRLYGDVVYVPRSIYAKREEMLAKHAESIVGVDGSIIWLNDVTETSFKHHESMLQKFPQADPINFPEKPKKVVIINEGAGDAVALLGMKVSAVYFVNPFFLDKNVSHFLLILLAVLLWEITEATLLIVCYGALTLFKPGVIFQGIW